MESAIYGDRLFKEISYANGSAVQKSAVYEEALCLHQY